MTLTLLTATQIKQASESEHIRDIARTETTRKALNTVQKNLDDTEARFEVALANQRIRWAKEEEEAVKRIDSLRLEVEELERAKVAAKVPIDREREITHNTFIEAEKVLADATVKRNEAVKEKEEFEEKSELLQDRLDALSEKANDLNVREQKVIIREEAVNLEREQIKKLSKELSIKLSNL